MSDMIYQRTIAKRVSVTGIGIHLGKKVTMVLRPAVADYGICFKRSDIPHAPVIKAATSSVSATENHTAIGQGIYAVHTVEHFLAVLYGLGINNLHVEIDGPEVPIMDGSGASFVFLLKEAGISTLNQSKKFMAITDTVEVRAHDKWAKIEPANKLFIDSTIVFAHGLIKKQHRIFEYSCENFINEIARARTFGLLRDVDALKKKGLIKGGSLDNAVVFDDFSVVNEDGLRFRDECVRHKILDTLGDMALLGHEIAGKVTTFKSGHNLHHALCRKILETPGAYEVISAQALRKETLDTFALPWAMTPVFR